jgi:uncharacterized membrane protein
VTKDLETLVGGALRVGSVLSTILLAIGVASYLAFGGSSIGWMSIHLGLLVVMATPVLRVAVSLAGFWRQRDWFFVAMTMAVLGVLAASVVVAFA